MELITGAIPCDDQPINGATLMGENRFLTSWITPNSLEIKEKYRELTTNIISQRDRITALWSYVKDIPYIQFVPTSTRVAGKVYQQNDTWLDPAQAIKAKRLNCFNKSVLLSSLLRQELPPEQVYVCLNNVEYDGIDGHAVSYLQLDEHYLLETTNPGIKSPFLLARDMDIYNAVLFFNDKGVYNVPDIALREPLGFCCLPFLCDYVNAKLCDSYV